MASQISRRLSIAAIAAPNIRVAHAAKRQTRLQASSASSLMDQIQEKNQQHDIMVYSKTWCPFCHSVKELFSDLQLSPQYTELDELADGSSVQEALEHITGSHTVPQIFIKGEFIGGASETKAMNSNGELVQKLDDAGIKHS